MVLDRLFGVWWEGGGFETVDRCRFLEGVASSGGRRERKVCNLSYNLYLLAGAHIRIIKDWESHLSNLCLDAA